MTPGFSLRDVSTGYRGRPVIGSISVDLIPPGTLVALVGPNAAGKSTLIKAIAGLRPATGRVLLDGDDLCALGERERLRRVGYLPQALPQASSLLAYEVWQGALRASRSDWTPARRERTIEEVVAAMGLDDLALRRLDELSGGQRQMVGLAQVIMRAPRLLLLDEPTSALDMRWQLRVLDTLQRLMAARGTTCVVAVHDLNLALRFCGQVLVLGQGRLRAAGRPGDVLSSALLLEVYGIEARVERCSHGHPLVIADAARTGPIAPDFNH